MFWFVGWVPVHVIVWVYDVVGVYLGHPDCGEAFTPGLLDYLAILRLKSYFMHPYDKSQNAQNINLK